MILFIVGFMGSGKSTMGREIARRLGWRFADTDRLAEEKAGMSVNDIFREYGEHHFRLLENNILEDLISAQSADTVVATGGGLPCTAGNMDKMVAAGYTVYLKMSVENLLGRLYSGRHKRPLTASLDREGLRYFIGEKLNSREAVYGRSSLVIDCDGVSDDYICRHVVNYIGMLAKPTD